MPCYDSRDDECNTLNHKLAAVLCGIITKHGLEVLSELDWKEIGVSKKVVMDWWQQHQKEDQARRVRERQVVKEKKTAKEAAKLLSQEQLVALLKHRTLK